MSFVCESEKSAVADGDDEDLVRSPSCQKSLSESKVSTLSALKRKWCEAKAGMCASAQCVNALKNMRAGKEFYFQPLLRPWSTRSNHASGIPKLRRCFRYVSVSVRLFRSEDLEKHASFLLYHLFDGELELFQSCQPLQILPLAAGSLWLCGSIAPLSTKMPSMPFFCFS